MCIMCTCGCLIACYQRRRYKSSASVEDVHGHGQYTSRRGREGRARGQEEGGRAGEEEGEDDDEEEESRTPRRAEDIIVDLASYSMADVDIESHHSPVNNNNNYNNKNHSNEEEAIRTARERVLAGLSAGVLVLRDDEGNEDNKDDREENLAWDNNSDEFSITIDFGKHIKSTLVVQYLTHHPHYSLHTLFSHLMAPINAHIALRYNL